MGVYDTYDGIQLKIGFNNLDEYNIGDETPLEDGIYVGYEGIALIKNGVFIEKYEFIIDKWGNRIFPREIIDHNNIISSIGKR